MRENKKFSLEPFIKRLAGVEGAEPLVALRRARKPIRSALRKG